MLLVVYPTLLTVVTPTLVLHPMSFKSYPAHLQMVKELGQHCIVFLAAICHILDQLQRTCFVSCLS